MLEKSLELLCCNRLIPRVRILALNLILWQLVTKKLEMKGNGKQVQGYLINNFFRC